MTTVVKSQINLTDVRQAWQLLTTPDQVVEVRAITALLDTDRLPYAKPRTISGYFTDVNKLTSSIVHIASAEGIYITINPCQPALLARVNNRLHDRVERTTNDDQLARRRILFLDCDPEREGGITGIPTNDSEHQAALEFVQSICNALTTLGWPAPLIIDSGNGAYLVYLIDLPANDEGLIQRVLAGLAKQYDTDAVHIDQTAYNQARIMRLPGTKNSKGDGTTDRPHRLARIIDAPDELHIVSSELLEEIATPVESSAAPEPSRKQTFSAEKTNYREITDFLDRHHIGYKPPKQVKGITVYVLTDGCVFNADHKGQDAAVTIEPDGKWGYNCFHTRCNGKEWKDFRRVFEPDYVPYNERQLSDKATTASVEKPRTRQMNESRSDPGPVTDNNGSRGSSVYVAPAPPSPEKPFHTTDLGNAERFALRYKDTVRWCETWKSWMVFNGKCWEQDKTGRADQLAKIVVRSIYAEASKIEDEDQRKRIAKHAGASESNRSVRAMLDRAKSELPAAPDDFNMQLYLLNCENGTLDLQTGELRPHNPHDMLTRCIKVKYNPLAWSQRWQGFISTILGEDADLITFMKQALGMSLCGDTSEQCLFICHGMGSNGKTTMLETVRIIMAAYACAANIETFQMRKTETIGNDVAELYGARLVTASETKLGGRLNESFVKKATGKEPLRARRLHENEFEFMPEFTLWLAVNHKPVVLDTSKGMWRRVHFVPFNVTIDGDQVDKHFGDKLLEEAEGVLAWLVQGCMEWIKQGHLTVPQIVKDATAGYRAEMDIVANFLEDECILAEGEKTSTKKLIERFESWCGHNSEKFDAKILKNSLKERGFHSQRGTGGSYYWQNIGLKPSSDNTKKQLWSDDNSEGSEGSEPKNRVNSNVKKSPDATLNSPSLPSLPSLPEHESDKKSEGTFTQLADDRENLSTPSLQKDPEALLNAYSVALRNDMGLTQIAWPASLVSERDGWQDGMIGRRDFHNRIIQSVRSADPARVQAAVTIMQAYLRSREV